MKIYQKSLLIIISLSLFSYELISQEVNDDFLDGLPDEVLKEVIGGDEEEYKEDIFVSDNSKINKTSIELERLIRETKSLEYKLNNLADDGPKLKRFGDDIFKTVQTTFMPINEPNVDPSYIVDVGDGIRLQVIGSLNIDKKIRVSRDGSINIPEIGKVFIAGLELNEVNKMIKKIISDSFIGNSAFITLDEIRNIKVYILGNVPSPGLYTLNGNSNLMHALSVAGGISENGSYRDIELKRSGKSIGSSDLYSILIYGDTLSNYVLRSGDVILVKPIKKSVSISGAVSRPAIYEMKADEVIDDLLSFAGDITGDFVDQSIILSKSKQNISKNIYLDKLSGLELDHNDSILVPFFKPEVSSIKTALVSGAVNFPGEYNISDSETLVSLINKAGGYKKDAYPFAGALIRQDALDKGKDFENREYGNLIKFLIAGSAGAESKAGMMTADSTTELLEEIRNYRSSNAGRYSIEFDLDRIDRDPSSNSKIKDGDSLYIPEFTNEVYLFGELNDPGTRRYIPGADVKDYINMAGGLAQNAYQDGVIVINPDGTTTLVDYSRFLNLTGNSKIDIYPHSVIYVPREIAKLDELTKSSYIAQIVSTASLPVLTLISIIDRD
ncbi:MAG: hypothetical protein CMD46_00995 [Gammaproteobacteria bacterium]|nr:hypothetical protein [Gammaproteobacteria bacterium]|tara:strand:- start:3131 stop:4966 length:1836 start_codon:yes stop_codon:yes gene_type:complete